MSMTPLEAHLDSIAHWERIATGKAGPGEKPCAEQCALCRLYANGEGEDCLGCPVRRSTGFKGCDTTPYYDVIKAYRQHGNRSPEFRAAAQAELDFLKSLLPKRGAKHRHNKQQKAAKIADGKEKQ